MQLKRIFRKANRIYNKMTKSSFRYCPVCDNKSDNKFMPLDPKYLALQKQNGFPYHFEDGETLNFLEFKCTFCGATDRDRLYALHLKQNLKKDSVCKLLDFAPSYSLQKFLKKNTNIQYRSADLKMEGVDDHINIEEMSIYNDSTFDIFICSHVLEHVNNDIKAMTELRRILKPGGWGIVMVPIPLKLKSIDEDISIKDPSERWKRFGQDDHVRLYSKPGFIERLEQVGFTVNQYGIKHFGKKVFEKCGIERKSVLYIVKK
jgi:SAM-dependent methyltransferase